MSATVIRTVRVRKPLSWRRLVLYGLLSIGSLIMVYPLVFAMFASLGLDPVLKRFERRGVKRPWAIAIVFLVLGVLGVGLLWLVVPTLIDQVAAFITGILRSQGPHDAARVNAPTPALAGIAQRAGDHVEDLLQSYRTGLEVLSRNLFRQFTVVVLGTGGTIAASRS